MFFEEIRMAFGKRGDSVKAAPASGNFQLRKNLSIRHNLNG
jgi:hypothetical protein